MVFHNVDPTITARGFKNEYGLMCCRLMVDRVQVVTRVPEKWRDEADKLDVTLAEYVRMIGRAGRLEWGFEHTEKPDRPHVKLEKQTQETDEQIDSIVEDAIIRNLSTDKGTTEEELVEIILNDIETQTGRLLNELAAADTVQYDAVKGGWVKQP